MLNWISRLLLIILLAGWQGAWADTAPVTAAPAAAASEAEAVLQQMQAAPARGLLYAISKQGQTAYLFGTIHVGRADFFPLDIIATQAMVQSSELVMEIDVSQIDKMQAGLQRYAALPPPQTLDALL